MISLRDRFHLARIVRIGYHSLKGTWRLAMEGEPSHREARFVCELPC
jgi:hypothetical protein